MKTHPHDLSAKDTYRVKKAARDAKPAQLPPGCTRLRDMENGAYYVWRRPGADLRVIVEAEMHGGELWLHVSLSRLQVLPTWDDVCAVKDLFIGDRKAIQVLPTKDEYVNISTICLNLYAPIDRDPLPDFRHETRDGQVGI